MELELTAAFPSGVLGPVLFKAFCLFASTCLDVATIRSFLTTKANWGELTASLVRSSRSPRGGQRPGPDHLRESRSPKALPH